MRWRPWLDPSVPNPAKSGELRYFKRAQNGKDEIETTADDPEGTSRTFILAKLEDNPFLRDDPQYRRILNNMPEPFRSQLLHGDWMAGAQDADYQVISSMHIRDAIMRWREWQGEGFPGTFTGLGADIGGGGAQSDKTTLADAYDGQKIKGVQVVEISDPEKATMEACGHIAIFLDNQRSGAAYIDTVGIGAGVYHRARELGMRAYAFKAGAATELMDKAGIYKFANWRSAAWWLLREMLEPGSGFFVCLPPDQELFADLTCPRFGYTSRGEIIIESKDLIRKRRKKSTDYADAVIQAIIGPILVEEELMGQERYQVHNFSRGR